MFAARSGRASSATSAAGGRARRESRRDECCASGSSGPAATATRRSSRVAARACCSTPGSVRGSSPSGCSRPGSTPRRSTRSSSRTSTATTRAAPPRSRRSGACRSEAAEGTLRRGGAPAAEAAGARGDRAGRRRARFARLTVRAVPVPHDAARPVAFVVTDGDVDLRPRDGPRPPLARARRGAARLRRDPPRVELRPGDAPGRALPVVAQGAHPRAASGTCRTTTWRDCVEKGLGEACRHVVLAHLSRKNNHAELVRMNAPRKRSPAPGRKAVQLTLAGVLGTDWIEVRRPGPPPGADRQLRLF